MRDSIMARRLSLQKMIDKQAQLVAATPKPTTPQTQRTMTMRTNKLRWLQRLLREHNKKYSKP
jgi:hypothetical protein